MLIVSEDSTTARNDAHAHAIVGHQVGESTEPPIAEQNEDEEFEGKFIVLYNMLVNMWNVDCG